MAAGIASSRRIITGRDAYRPSIAQIHSGRRIVRAETRFAVRSPSHRRPARHTGAGQPRNRSPVHKRNPGSSRNSRAPSSGEVAAATAPPITPAAIAPGPSQAAMPCQPARCGRRRRRHNGAGSERERRGAAQKFRPHVVLPLLKVPKLFGCATGRRSRVAWVVNRAMAAVVPRSARSSCISR